MSVATTGRRKAKAPPPIEAVPAPPVEAPVRPRATSVPPRPHIRCDACGSEKVRRNGSHYRLGVVYFVCVLCTDDICDACGSGNVKPLRTGHMECGACTDDGGAPHVFRPGPGKPHTFKLPVS